MLDTCTHTQDMGVIAHLGGGLFNFEVLEASLEN